MIQVGLAFLGVGLVGVLWAERSSSPARGPLKLLASTGFVLVAIGADALSSPFGRWILVGLGLSWIGDAALLGRSDAWFLGGLGAFLLAHVTYVAAFLTTELPLPPVASVIGALWLVAAIVIARWLLPHVRGRLRRPVIAYLIVISTMVLLASPAGADRSTVLIPIGAIAFALSDVAVARDKFVVQDVANRMWGLPLYYVGQLLLALSVA